MIYFKTNEEIELLKESSLLVAKTHAEVAKHIQPGVTTQKLDQKAEEFILDHGGTPGFKGYNEFPATLCVSINDEVVHGIPGTTVLEDGDIVSVDCGVLMNGFYGDSAFTYSVGNISKEAEKLLDVTRDSLYKGIEMAVVGNRLGDIGYAIQHHSEAYGFSVVREFVGHGIGRNLHEKPEVPNYGKRGSGIKLKEGMVIAIEPMINLGGRHVKSMDDNWTIKTTDGSLSAHFEHTVAVRKEQAEILSSFKYVDEVLKRNEHLLLI